MLSWIRGTKSPPSPPANNLATDALSDAQLELLCRFRHGATTEGIVGADHWDAALGVPAGKAIDKLSSALLLEPAPLDVKVCAAFNAAKLKALLKERGLKVSGKKAELATRLVEHDAKDVELLVRNVVAHQCTDEGLTQARAYLERQEKSRKSAYSSMLDALRARNYKAAAAAVASFEATQVFSRGIGIDWTKYSFSRDAEMLRIIFEATPGILKGISPDRLEPIRIVAAEMMLWGTNRSTLGFEKGFETGIHLDPTTAARMFCFNASHQANLKGHRAAGIKKVEVLGCGADSCPACRALEGKKFKLNDVPELPHPNCTSELGCRCTAVAADF